MNIERMERLSNFLRNEVPPERFDFRSWFTVVGRRFWSGRPGNCKTVACALGWACAIPEFRKAGLKVNKFDMICFGKSSGAINAAERFFHLDTATTEKLFSSCHFYGVVDPIYITPAMVANKIDELVAKERANSAATLTTAALAKAATGAEHEKSPEYHS